jgi:hypothetical protein
VERAARAVRFVYGRGNWNWRLKDLELTLEGFGGCAGKDLELTLEGLGADA